MMQFLKFLNHSSYKLKYGTSCNFSNSHSLVYYYLIIIIINYLMIYIAPKSISPMALNKIDLKT